MKEFFAKKSIGFYLTMAAAVCGIIAVSLFAASRENKDGAAIIALLAIAIVCSAAIAVRHFTLTEYVPLVLNAAATGLIFVVLLNNIADIFAKNNVIGLSAGFIVSIVFCFLATIASCAAVICKHEK